MEDEVNVLYQDKNYGHRVCERDDIVALGGDRFVVTDPDLLLNKKLPINFLDILSDLSDIYQTNKIGFALDTKHNIDESRRLKTFDNMSIKEFESQYWRHRIYDPDYELYRADIDTTFALMNKKYYDKGSLTNAIRIAGDFTCIHRPWLKNYEDELLPGEKDFYLNINNVSSTQY
jgi:hypothetical protein